MTSNCTKTKFNGTLSNDNLPIYDGFVLNIKSSSSATFETNSLQVSNLEVFVVESLNGSDCLIADPVDESVLPSSGYSSQLSLAAGTHTIVFANLNSKVKICGKYKTVAILKGGYDVKNYEVDDLSALDYSYNMNTLFVRGLGGRGILSFKSKNNKLQNIDLTELTKNNALGIDIETLCGSLNYNNINLINTASVGNIDNLFNTIAEGEGSLGGTINFTRTSCTGTVEGIAEALKAMGNYSRLVGLNRNVTCKGSACGEGDYKFASADSGLTYSVSVGSTSIGTYDTVNKQWI